MSIIEEIRENMETKLAKWEASVRAVETQLQQSQEQAMEVLEIRKKRLKQTVEEFKSEIVQAKGLADARKTEIQCCLDELQVQLALGKAEARDSFEAQKSKILGALARLEATIDRQVDASDQAINESLRKAVNSLIVAAIKLEAEMEYLAIRIELRREDARDRFQHDKRVLIQQINRYKRQLDDSKQMAKDKVATFESELSAGIAQIKQAFRNLVG